jgi:8-oxo-dGTP diphosphatase
MPTTEADKAPRRVLFVSAAVLIDGQGRVLLASRPPGTSMAGLWEFPGGKMRPGETPEAALVRELAEELALEVSQGDLEPLTFASHDYGDFHLVMPLFACRSWRGTPTPQEGQDLQWVAPGDMTDIPMPPADYPLVAVLKKVL